MPFRHLPPVSSPVAFQGLMRAGAAALGAEDSDAVRGRVVERITQRFGAASVALTDSGTSALVIAMRAVVRAGGTVALPAYGCVDLLAAAIRADVGVRLYDIDPGTLGPDLDSLRCTLLRGVDAVVVTHLYGYPADIAGVQGLASAAGVGVIEDAAQQAGARVRGVPVGSHGPVTVLSFGRGKGTTGGRGGAVFTTAGADAAIASAIATWREGAPPARAGWGDLSRAAAQWAFGRPSLYAVPASIPALGLGQTIYRPASEPGTMSHAAAALVERALARVDADRDARARRAAWYVERLSGAATVRLVRPSRGAEPGYLRFPILCQRVDPRRVDAAGALGVVRTYPRPLSLEPAITGILRPGEPPMQGARALCEQLLTLPTQVEVTDRDAERIRGWAIAGAT